MNIQAITINHKEKGFVDVDIDGISREIWNNYIFHVAEKLPHLAEISKKYWSSRCNDTNAIPFIARFSCALSEVFKINESNVIRAACLGTLMLDQFTQILDDIDDIPSHNEVLNIHGSHELMLAGIALMIKSCNNPRELFEILNNYIFVAMHNERELLNLKDVKNRFEDKDYMAMAYRGGIMRATAAFYADCADRSSVLSIVEDCILRISLAIQLLDDVVDWQEDFFQKKRTSILSDFIHDIKRDNIKISDLYYKLIRKGTFEKNIEKAIAEIEITQKALVDLNGNITLNILAGINISARRALEIIRQKKKNYSAGDIDDFKKDIISVSGMNMMH